RIVPRAPSAAPLRQVAAARSSARRFHRELPSAPELEEPWTTRGPRRGARPHCLSREPTQFGRGCAARTARNKSISLNKMSGGGGNRRHSGLVRQLFARRDLTAHQPEILRELDPVAFLLIPRRAGWNRGFMAT